MVKQTAVESTFKESSAGNLLVRHPICSSGVFVTEGVQIGNLEEKILNRKGLQLAPKAVAHVEVLCNRTTMLGNPFMLGPLGKTESLRGNCIDAYRVYLQAIIENDPLDLSVIESIACNYGLDGDKCISPEWAALFSSRGGAPAVRAALAELRSLVAAQHARGGVVRLLCHCAPLPCHCGAIAQEVLRREVLQPTATQPAVEETRRLFVHFCGGPAHGWRIVSAIPANVKTVAEFAKFLADLASTDDEMLPSVSINSFALLPREPIRELVRDGEVLNAVWHESLGSTRREVSRGIRSRCPEPSLTAPTVFETTSSAPSVVQVSTAKRPRGSPETGMEPKPPVTHKRRATMSRHDCGSVKPSGRKQKNPTSTLEALLGSAASKSTENVARPAEQDPQEHSLDDEIASDSASEEMDPTLAASVFTINGAPLFQANPDVARAPAEAVGSASAFHRSVSSSAVPEYQVRPGVTPATSVPQGTVPRISASWKHSTGLVDILAKCGIAYLEMSSFCCPGTENAQSWPPHPEWQSWRKLWHEATSTRAIFRRRKATKARLMAFNKGEDLRRTLDGVAKAHEADWRYNFGVTMFNGTHRDVEEWGDLCWVPNGFQEFVKGGASWIRQELLTLVNCVSTPGSDSEPVGTLGDKICKDAESWGNTRLRHSLYLEGGSCTEHTDYGIVTFQQSTGPGLEAEIDGAWWSVEPEDGCMLVFAGDMLERLTNGRVKALKHRVRLPEKHKASNRSHGPDAVCRQAHILFLQPSRDTVVQPLRRYLKGDVSDLEPIRYGDWHNIKAGLAFSRP